MYLVLLLDPAISYRSALGTIRSRLTERLSAGLCRKVRSILLLDKCELFAYTTNSRVFSLKMNTQKILHGSGLRSTPARIAVLDLLEKQKNPTDVLSIVETLDHQADQATIYRVLEILTKKGIISRLEFGEGKYRYELQKSHHHHLVCTNCGVIKDVPGDFLGKFEKEIRNKEGFLVKSHSLEFFGLCKNCQS